MTIGLPNFSTFHIPLVNIPCIRSTTLFITNLALRLLVIAPASAGTLQPKIVAATERHLKLKVADYAGATLLKINNKNPVAYIEQFAKKGGTYKDLNARIN